MLKKRFVVSFFFLFFLSISNSVSAKPGCCSGHDGVNCGAGAQGSGKVICNDGWRGSSCLYSEMVMCGGAPSSKPAVTIAPTKTITTPKPISTPKPKAVPAYTKASVSSTPKPSKKVISCSATKDSKCPSNCSAGNDMDCCEQKLINYTWYENRGCYPKQEAECSGIADNICPSHCDNGWDADCCEQNLVGYRWYENWGCYEE